jgi:hypothetical protein
MRSLITLALVLTWMLLGVAVTACSNDNSDYSYENDTHGGYPGPGTRTQNRN